MKRILFFVSCSFSLISESQTVKLFTPATKASFRGLSVVDDNTVWVSGSTGTVGRSWDGGQTWKWIVVRGF